MRLTFGADIWCDFFLYLSSEGIENVCGLLMSRSNILLFYPAKDEQVGSLNNQRWWVYSASSARRLLSDGHHMRGLPSRVCLGNIVTRMDNSRPVHLDLLYRRAVYNHAHGLAKRHVMVRMMAVIFSVSDKVRKLLRENIREWLIDDNFLIFLLVWKCI